MRPPKYCFLFPTWEHFVPNVGTIVTQRRNISYSTWEHLPNYRFLTYNSVNGLR